MNSVKRRNISTVSAHYGDNECSDPSAGSCSFTNPTSSNDAINSASNNHCAADSYSSPDQDTPRRNYSASTVMSLNNITHSNSSPPENVSDNVTSRVSGKRGRPIDQESKRWIAVNPKNNTSGEPPPLSPDESHLDQLVLGVLNLFTSYSTANESSNSSNSAGSDSSNNNSGSCNGSSMSDIPEPGVNVDRIKHELISTLRNAVPLNYLQDVCKKNEVESIRWYPCTHSKCYNLYLSKGSQRRHTYSHTGERPYICKFPGCDKSYSASDRLAEHMHSHTNQRPYRCTFEGCSKAYNDPKTLREHKRTHGEKTFSCNVPKCGKSFHRKTHLKQHLRTHNNEEAIVFLDTPKPISPLPSSNFHRSLLNNSNNSHFQVNRRSPNP